MPNKKSVVSLRTVADRVGLAPCSVSAILNQTAAAQAIPQSTKDRVFRTAAELNYRPNLWARSLRAKRTRMIAVASSDFGRGAVGRVISGAQNRMHQRGYLLALATINKDSAQLRQRGVEGLIAVDIHVSPEIDLPVASVELSYVIGSGLSTEGASSLLLALGESAADTIIRQIESEVVPRRMNVNAKIPAAYFEASPQGMSRTETRETA